FFPALPSTYFASISLPCKEFLFFQEALIIDNYIEFNEEGQGGAKGRLVRLAELCDGKVENIKFFCDRDYDEFMQIRMPNNVITTDYRDLEGYVFYFRFIEKSLYLGLKTNKIKPSALFESVLNISREIGILRILSLQKKYNLPLNQTPFKKHIFKSNGNYKINLQRYLKVLLQKVNISISLLDSIFGEFKLIKEKYSTVHSKYLIRGKDAFYSFEHILEKEGFKHNNFRCILWAAFDFNEISEDTIRLRELLRFITNK
ncbi:MAG: hypothetical protein JXD23_03160, partial [Spirochaetales bacterium]|nr:hypothetical protein [Spirochaetales bacterium]